MSFFSLQSFVSGGHRYPPLSVFVQRVMLLALFVLALSACGGGSDSGGAVGISTTGTPATAVSNSNPTVPASVANGNNDSDNGTDNDPIGTGIKVEALLKADTELDPDQDGDGLPNSIDPFPAQATQLAVPQVSVSETLRLDTVLARVAGQRLPEYAVEDGTLELKGNGFEDYGQLIWGVFSSAEGDIAVEATVIDEHTLSLPAPGIKSQRVRVVTSEWHSNTLAFNWLNHKQPLLFPPAETATYTPGEQVVLKGQFSEPVLAMRMGDADLRVDQQTDESLSFTLPALPGFGQVQAVIANQVSNSLPLKIEREVSVQVDTAGLPLRDGDALSVFWSGGVATLDAPLYQADIMVSATEPVVVVAAISDQQGNNYIDQLRGVIWPGETQLLLSALSTVQADVYRHLQRFNGSVQQDVATRKTAWEKLVSQPVLVQFAQQYAAQSRSAAGYPAGLEAEREALFARLELENQAASTSTVARNVLARSSVFATPTLPDDVHVTVAVPKYTPRNEYNNFAVDLANSGTCTGLESLTPPSNLSPASLCVENDSVVTASINVVDTFSGKSLGQHVGSRFDPDVLGGSYAGYLYLASIGYPKDKKGNAVCELKPCRIELLTGSLGILTDSSVVLSKAEKDVAFLMKSRTMFELILLPYLEAVTGLELNGKTCRREIINTFGGSKSGFLASVYDLQGKMKGSNTATEKLASFNDTIGKWLIALLTDPQNIAKVVSACASSQTVGAIEDHVKGKLSATARTASGALIMAKAFDVIITGIEFTGPEKIVFDVAYGSRIEGFDSSIDLLADASAGTPATVNISFNGNMLVAERNGSEHYPTLVLRDANGITVRKVLTADYLTPRSSTDYYTKFFFSVPFNVTQLAGLQSPLTLTLNYSDTSYDGYPNKELPIPFPQQLTLLKAPQITSVNPSPVNAGSNIKINGTRLNRLNSNNGMEVFMIPQQGSKTYFLENVRLQSNNLITGRIPTQATIGDYTLFVAEKGYRDSGGSSQYLVDSTSMTVSALSGVTLLVQDRGKYEDDQFTIKFYAPGNDETPIQTITLPDQGSYGVNTSWDPAKANQKISWIEVTCKDTGRDNLCTYYLDIQGTALYKQLTCSGTAIRKESGKMSEGDANIYNVGSRTGSGCQQ